MMQQLNHKNWTVQIAGMNLTLNKNCIKIPDLRENSNLQEVTQRFNKQELAIQWLKI